jgi:hypothetical protein
MKSKTSRKQNFPIDHLTHSIIMSFRKLNSLQTCKEEASNNFNEREYCDLLRVSETQKGREAAQPARIGTGIERVGTIYKRR